MSMPGTYVEVIDLTNDEEEEFEDDLDTVRLTQDDLANPRTSPTEAQSVLWLDNITASLINTLGKVKMLAVWSAFERFMAFAHPNRYGLDNDKPQGLQLKRIGKWLSRSWPFFLFGKSAKADFISYGGILFCWFYVESDLFRPRFDQLASSLDFKGWCLALSLADLGKLPALSLTRNRALVYVWMVGTAAYVGVTSNGERRDGEHKNPLRRGVNNRVRSLFSSGRHVKADIVSAAVVLLPTSAPVLLAYALEHILLVAGRFLDPAVLGGFSGLNVNLHDCCQQLNVYSKNLLLEIWNRVVEFCRQNPKFIIPSYSNPFLMQNPDGRYDHFLSSVRPDNVVVSLSTIADLLFCQSLPTSALEWQQINPLPKESFGGHLPVAYRADYDELMEHRETRSSFVRRRDTKSGGRGTVETARDHVRFCETLDADRVPNGDESDLTLVLHRNVQEASGSGPSPLKLSTILPVTPRVEKVLSDSLVTPLPLHQTTDTPAPSKKARLEKSLIPKPPSSRYRK